MEISTGTPRFTSYTLLTPRSRIPYCIRLRSLLHGSMRSSAPRLQHPLRCISRKAAASDGDNRTNVVDRRDVLLGLGAGAAAAIGAPRRALAAPIKAPDLRDCHAPEDLPEAITGATNCCPTYDGTGIVDFELPVSAGSSPVTRVRPAAQLVDAEYVAKYEKAIRLMKDLPADDPRSFEQQWRVHCAYCDGAYDQAGFPDLEIQIHNCWLFFPWHRFYLYFHERILGKLLGDDSFALPFWNWDAPAGMALPSIYNVSSSSPLYDPKRNPAHQPPFLLGLDYSGTDDDASGISRDNQIDENLRIMYRQMVSNAKKPQLFLGQPYRAGDDADPGAGSIENVPHGIVHFWTGDPREANQEDMGNFYSAARDPVFFAHHANIDRLWHVWRSQIHNNNNGGFDFADPEWLDAAFLFYDEEARLVRVRVRDCLDMASLGYAYQEVPLPWLDARPTKPASPGTPARALDALPATLDKTVRVAVARPRASRSAKEKEEQEEVVVVEGIQVSDCSRFVKFDVLVNVPDGDAESGMGAAYCAGSVALTPHAEKRKEKGAMMKTVARFGVCDLLENIGADGDEMVVVSLVPRCGGELVTIGGVSIGYAK
ncbi:polyphenol oxidase I, chloroplastic [Brachypodium distachyon]|uniref:Tyrosinase copper-binding domain-containing protein n=1 Tax=Brachypodium distachyon TaxID=15368 RepID=A0A2K2CIP6_BRADI|nr:polyphenol oxidase I, chloroplastic [Brachypodium distachyon]PNT61885.1 hypothetical protein BRADI_5g22300v3 [Brachypodium distachyon]|eukprot:XP_010227274.2 polyphenol oxidase I, chloroplastic [Brachypodium distachyon]